MFTQAWYCRIFDSALQSSLSTYKQTAGQSRYTQTSDTRNRKTFLLSAALSFFGFVSRSCAATGVIVSKRRVNGDRGVSHCGLRRLMDLYSQHFDFDLQPFQLPLFGRTA